MEQKRKNILYVEQNTEQGVNIVNSEEPLAYNYQHRHRNALPDGIYKPPSNIQEVQSYDTRKYVQCNDELHCWRDGNSHCNSHKRVILCKRVYHGEY